MKTTIIALFVLTSFQLTAQTLAGTVHSRRGKPLPGANVIGTGEFASEGRINGTVTGTDGRFILTLDPGPNNVIINAAGYKAVSHKVSVNKGDTLFVDVYMGKTARHYWEVIDRLGRKVSL